MSEEVGQQDPVVVDQPDQTIPEELRSKRVFCSNLPYRLAWQGLKDWANQQVGGAVFARIFREPRQFGGRGRSKGSGIVEFDTPERAQEAIRLLNETILMERTVYVREDQGPQRPQRFDEDFANPQERLRPRPTREFQSSGRAIYVGNVNYATTAEALRERLEEFGTIVEFDMPLRDGRSRGYVLVEFETEDEASNAISELNQEEMDGRNLVVRLDQRK